jgi:hypothetical protein
MSSSQAKQHDNKSETVLNDSNENENDTSTTTKRKRKFTWTPKRRAAFEKCVKANQNLREKKKNGNDMNEGTKPISNVASQNTNKSSSESTLPVAEKKRKRKTEPEQESESSPSGSEAESESESSESSSNSSSSSSSEDKHKRKRKPMKSSRNLVKKIRDKQFMQKLVKSVVKKQLKRKRNHNSGILKPKDDTHSEQDEKENDYSRNILHKFPNAYRNISTSLRFI